MQKLKSSGLASVNGLKMYYEIYGSGNVPLVLIHGGGSTIQSSFANLIPLLADYGEVIAVELQAHGRTTDRNGPESFEQDADDVAGLLGYLKINKANFLGFSNGGSTAMQIAIKHPGIVKKIVVVSGAYKRDGFIPGFFDGFKGATLENMPEPLRNAFLKVTPDMNRLQGMFEKDVARMESFTDWPDSALASIKAPALIIAAEDDVVTPAHMAQMATLIPDARHVILPGTHGSVIGEVGSAPEDGKMPGITASLVLEFLGGHAARP